jgi:hypothetical protein
VRLGGLFVCLTVLWPTGAYADQSGASLQVAAIVRASASLVVVDQPSFITVSEEEIAQGYKPLAATYRVSGKSADGYLLDVQPMAGLTDAIEVRGLAGQLVLRDLGVEIALPPTDRGAEIALEIGMRLRNDALPGTYPFPLHLSLTPL